jgi:hypothetical protein
MSIHGGGLKVRWGTRYRSTNGFECTIELENDDLEAPIKMADELMGRMLKSGVKPMSERPPIPISQRRIKR